MSHRNFAKVVTGSVKGSRWPKQVAVFNDGTCSVVEFSPSGSVNQRSVTRSEAASVMNQVRNGRNWKVRVSRDV